MATQHLTEDDLILHYYGETAPAQRAARPPAHLERVRDRAAASYTRLQRVLAVVDETRRGGRSCRRRSSARCGRGSSRTCARRGAAGCRWFVFSPAPLGLGRGRRRAGRRRVLRRPGALAARRRRPTRQRQRAAEQSASASCSSTSASISIARRWCSWSWSAPTTTTTVRYLGRARARRAAGRRQPALSADRGIDRRRGAQRAARRARAGAGGGRGQPGDGFVARSRRRAAPHRVERPALQGPRRVVGGSRTAEGTNQRQAGPRS